jgi:hypothetical protein
MGFSDQFGKFLMGDWKGIGKGGQNEGSFQFDNWGEGLTQLGKQLLGWVATAVGGTEGMGALGGLFGGGGAATGEGGAEAGSSGFMSNLSEGLSGLWDKAGSGLDSIWDKLGPKLSGTETNVTGGSSQLYPGGSPENFAGSGMGTWEQPGGMSLSSLSDMMQQMGGQKNQSGGGGSQSLEPLYKLLEATKRSAEDSRTANIQPLPPMRSMF